jgi:steroid 5-alpha reductase family enzyme
LTTFFEVLQIYAQVAVVILLLMSPLWLISLILRNASIVDIFWGTGFVIICWLYPLAQSGQARRLPLSGLTERSRIRS